MKIISASLCCSFLLLFLTCQSGYCQTTDLDLISTLAKTFFRDSAELPMDVAVTTTVKTADGKVKRDGHATVHMLFHGYSHTGKFSLNAKGSFMDKGEMMDSLNGDLAAFAAGALLAKPRDKSVLEVQTRDQSARPSLVKLSDPDCPPFTLTGERPLFPTGKSFCGIATFSLGSDSSGGLIFRHFSFDNAGLPAQIKVHDLGNVEITAFRIEEDFQSWTMHGETKPFLLPQQVLVSIRTNKGTIDFTNRYTPSPSK